MGDTKTQQFPTIAVKAKISKPSSKSGIKVKGTTLDEIRADLNRYKHWGEYDAKADATYKKNGDKMIVEVTITAKPEIEMPVWKGYSKAPKDAKDAWDAMYAKLQKHETNHHNLSLEVFAKFAMEIETKNAEIEKINKALEKESDEKKRQAILKGFEPMTETVMKARLVQLSSDLQGAQDEYDTKSDHGKKEGVKI